MAGTTPVTIHEEVVSSSKGIGDSWALLADEIHTSSVINKYFSSSSPSYMNVKNLF